MDMKGLERVILFDTNRFSIQSRAVFRNASLAPQFLPSFSNGLATNLYLNRIGLSKMVMFATVSVSICAKEK